MQKYHKKLPVSKDGKIVVPEVPFSPGEEVDVYILSKKSEEKREGRYPLHGVKIGYVKSFSPISEDEWESDS